MPKLKAFFRPQSLKEALELLTEHGSAAKPLAGGTSLVFSNAPRTEALIDLRDAGLGTLAERKGGLHIGSMVSLSRLRNYLKDKKPSAAGEAAAGAGSRVLQNHITVGGNCVQVYAWSDLPVAFSVLDARFVLQSDSQRVFTATEWFDGPPARKITQGELLVEVVLPDPPPGFGSSYLKVVRTTADHSLAGAAASVVLDDGLVKAVRVAAGAVRFLPQTLDAAEEVLLDQEPTAERLAEAGRKVAQQAKVTVDFRIAADYRKHLLATLASDALTAAVARAGGEA